MSMIEVMMSAGIALTIALGSMSMVMTTLRSERNTTSLSDYANLQDRVKLFISNPSLCPKMLKDTKTNTLTMQGETITVGSKLPSGSTITNVTISIIAPTSNHNEYSAYVNLAGLKNEFALGPKPLKAVVIPVTITTDGTTSIIACSTISTAIAVSSPTPMAMATPIPSPTPISVVDQCILAGGKWKQDGNSNNYKCVK